MRTKGTAQTRTESMVGAAVRQQGGGGGGVDYRGLLLAVGKVSKICGYATVVGGRPWEGTEVSGRP